MKKNIHYITIAAAFVAVAAMIIGCKPNITPAQDTTAPAEVTELKPIPRKRQDKFKLGKPRRCRPASGRN